MISGLKIAQKTRPISALVMGVLVAFLPMHKALAENPTNGSMTAPPQTYLEVISSEGLEFPRPLIDGQLVQKVIPLNLNPEAEAEILPRIVDHSITSFFESPLVQNTTAVKVAKAVEKSMATDVAIQSENSNITHKFKVQMMALQRSAHFAYTGLTNASVLVNMATASTLLQINERLTTRQTLVVSHEHQGSGLTAQQISWHLSW